jgi:hypothetical protein
MKFHRARRITGAVAVLLGALASITVVGPLAGIASAATAPTISYKYPGQVSGSGFTPGLRRVPELPRFVWHVTNRTKSHC